MDKVSKYLPFVNDQREFHETMAAKYASTSPKRAERHIATAALFKELGEDLERLPSILSQRAETTTSPQPKAQSPISLTFDDIQGLPDELLQELSFSDGDKTDYSILKVVEEIGGVASIDRILVGLYRKTGEIMKRNTLTSRLYRMGQKGMLFSVPGKKGVYSTEELTESQALDLFKPN
jgi:hypothetical protein